jgi:hypothetical protein
MPLQGRLRLGKGSACDSTPGLPRAPSILALGTGRASPGKHKVNSNKNAGYDVFFVFLFCWGEGGGYESEIRKKCKKTKCEIRKHPIHLKLSISEHKKKKK